ncbi:MAG: hypothetical protein WCA84_01465 [Ignavibacteriaceae bacterium]
MKIQNYNSIILNKAKFITIIFSIIILTAGSVKCQQMPDVRGRYEEYPVNMVNYWQSRETLKNVQVVVLRDPAGEQEARFDLTHGATLISLRYQGKELLFGHSAGANIEMINFRPGKEKDLEGLSPFWSAFLPSQGGSSMGVPSTTAGVACDGEKSMKAFSMMVDAGVNNSFQKNPLIAVWEGKLSDNFPPGYSTPYSIETDADWVKNPKGEPKYYLKLHQVVINIRPGGSQNLQWMLEGAAPWFFNYKAVYAPANCTEQTPCSSATAPVLMTGRYQDSSKTHGFAIVVPTTKWDTKSAYVLENAEYVKLLYGAVWAAPRHTFAVVLSHPLAGLSPYSFDWYICAGSWNQACTFGKSAVK